MASKLWSQGTLLAIMLDQLRPLQGTSYELPSLKEKVTPDNISLILYSSPIMTCRIPLPSDISYSGYGTSSHKVKVLWCLTLFLINVYDFLTYATTTFPQTIRNCGGVGPMSLEFYWCEWSKSYLCRQSMLLCDFYHHGIYFLTSSVCCADVWDKLSTPCCGQRLHYATCLLADSLLCADTRLKPSAGLPACCLMVKNESCHVVIV